MYTSMSCCQNFLVLLNSAQISSGVMPAHSLMQEISATFATAANAMGPESDACTVQSEALEQHESQLAAMQLLL